MRKAVFVVGFASVARHAGRDDRSDWAIAEGRMRSIQGGMPPALPGCPNFSFDGWLAHAIVPVVHLSSQLDCLLDDGDRLGNLRRCAPIRCDEAMF